MTERVIENQNDDDDSNNNYQNSYSIVKKT